MQGSAQQQKWVGYLSLYIISKWILSNKQGCCIMACRIVRAVEAPVLSRTDPSSLHIVFIKHKSTICYLLKWQTVYILVAISSDRHRRFATSRLSQSEIELQALTAYFYSWFYKPEIGPPPVIFQLIRLRQRPRWPILPDMSCPLPRLDLSFAAALHPASRLAWPWHLDTALLQQDWSAEASQWLAAGLGLDLQHPGHSQCLPIWISTYLKVFHPERTWCRIAPAPVI